MEEPNDNNCRFIIIPEYIVQQTNINNNEKLLFGEILSLSYTKGYCFASNKYFSNLFGTTTKTVSVWISKLVAKQYITRELIYDENHKEVIERRLRVNQNDEELRKFLELYLKTSLEGIDVFRDTPIEDFGDTSIDKNVDTPLEENVKENNIKFNNKFLNINSINYPNIALTEKELSYLLYEFTEPVVQNVLNEYSSWKKSKNANVKSDFEQLRKWLDKKNNQVTQSTVQINDTDEISDSILQNILF